MLTVLADYLSDAATPETKESIRRAHELFDAYGMETYEEGFIEILMTDGDADTGVSLQSIIQLTRTLQYQILEQHGLIISEDASVSTLNIFLHGLRLIPDYDNASSLMSFLTMTGDPQEILAECIALVTGTSADVLIGEMKNADPKILQTMVEQLDQMTIVETDEQLVLKRHRIARYKLFIEGSQIKHLKLAYLLENGMDVGHPFMVYLNLIGQDFDEMEAQAIANELIAMCVISSDASNNPRAAITDHIEQFVSDINKITKIDILVNDLLLKLNHNEKA
jgi:hypothetical protein